MSPKRLIKYFPELAHLPTEEQQALLLRAQKNIENKHNLQTLVDNLLRVAVLGGICLLFIWYVRPVLGISHPVAAIMIMMLVLPAYLLIQQRAYLQKIRTEVQKQRA